MDSRKYDAIHQVAPGQFSQPQRQRLEAFTAATKLCPDRTTDEQLEVARFIVEG